MATETNKLFFEERETAKNHALGKRQAADLASEYGCDGALDVLSRHSSGEAVARHFVELLGQVALHQIPM